MNPDIIKQLGAPFPFEEVEAKIQVNSGDKKSGLAVFYLDSRAIQNRLDEVIGPLNWANNFSSWQNNAQICGISIYNNERGEWITKHDGADNSNIAAVKGGLTDAFKRAAVLWGIGRYLYQIDGVWVDIEIKGNSSIIKSDQKPRLKAAYDAAVKKVFGSAPTTAQPVTASNVGSKASVANASKQSANHSTVNQQSQQQKPAPQSASPQTSLQATTQTAPPPQTATQNTPPPQAASNVQPKTNMQAPTNQQTQTEQKPNDNVVSMYDYKIHSVQPAGSGSHKLELHGSNGEVTTAYAKPGETRVAVGKHLKNVKLEAKTSAYGNYNLLVSFDVAA